MKRFAAVCLAMATAAAFAGASVASAEPSAPPGGDALYQVEISANVPGSHGGGSWFWLELDRDGSGIYAGADCAHGASASPARGALTWQQQGDQLLIHGIQSTDLPRSPTSPPSCRRHTATTSRPSSRCSPR